ncbi:hypothetical protein [Corynebacterium kozikiae]|uniref:hypothetical protein n=1 Tax=Corynebacterium kozikiae TaxID=2968469 RepID=UPI00211C2EA0|nr:hypothetical protein [Corynebacterium sp. 76QC2CO]MCQ9343424.1 hypothetical protein [Corynebacterium sp. 76QC2CO]
MALDWFGQTLGNNSAPSDPRFSAQMPAVPAALAAMNPPMLVAQVAQSAQETVVRIAPKDIGSVCSRGLGDSAQTTPMCPEPDAGVMMAISEVSHITTASVDVLQYKQTARKIAVHAAPFGSSPDGSSTVLKLTLRFADGQSLELAADGSHPALKNRETDVSSGQYIPATIEFALPEELQEIPVAEIELSASSPIEVRGIDVVGEKPAE